MKYVKHKITKVVKCIPEYLLGDYLNTGEWERATQEDYDTQQNKVDAVKPKPKPIVTEDKNV